MKFRFSKALLCACVLALGLAVVPATTAGAAIPAPGVPQNLTVVAGGNQITVTWSAPITGATPTSYQVYTADAAIRPQCASVAPPTTTCTYTLAANRPPKKTGQTLGFKVRAYNTTKAGPWTPVVKVLFGKPTIPAGVTADPGNGDALVSWGASTGSNWPVTGYTVTASGGGGQTCTTATTSCTVPSLTDGASYTFTVTATNAVGTTAPSAPSNAVVPGAPDAPTGVTAVAGPFSASVSFTPPVDDNGSPITYYTVTAYDLTNPSDPSNGTQWTGSGSPINKPSLTGGHTYEFTVSATNALGAGAESAPSNQVTLANVPDAPTGVTAVAGIGSASVSFTPGADNGSAITFYAVTAWDITNPSDPSNGTQWGGGSSPINKPFLVSGHTYEFTVSASNGIGQGPDSVPSNQVVVL